VTLAPDNARAPIRQGYVRIGPVCGLSTRYVREGWRAGFGEPVLTAGELAGVGKQWPAAGLQASTGRLWRIACVSSADGVGWTRGGEGPVRGLGDYSRRVSGIASRSASGVWPPDVTQLRCTTTSSCGRRRWAGGSTFTPRTMSRRCWRWGYSPSRRSPAPGSGSAPQWRPRPGSRDGTSAAARRTGTGWRMPGRTRTRRTRRGVAGRTGSSRIRSPRRSSGGCSHSGWPGTAPRGSPGL
jgi:hypothetical protein